ncbi:MAG: threonyl-tRNA synthetase editing domain-containing protein [Desulfobacteraceae bacterium]|nr:threonyl-tRNA synthetase editing domain-containing protein [Desulfobacteraceae bacterium]MDH3957639.1 threonyl-tRNA synthetase editing domain-containing protein [Desulfobacteraceae bacterium]
MRVLFWFCDDFDWTPAIKTLPDVPEAEPAENRNTVVAFVHIEPRDVESGSSSETKLVKNAKWLARKWETLRIILHSFTHLGQEKADPEKALELLDRTKERLENAGYSVDQTPYGYFLDLKIKAPGHPLARVYKEF